MQCSNDKCFRRKERIQANSLCSFSDYDYTDNHKNYNFFDCDWFKNLLFYTNLLTKLLSDSSMSQSHSELKFESSNQPFRKFSFITWLFFFSRKF